MDVRTRLKGSAWKGFIPRRMWKSPSLKQILGLEKKLLVRRDFGPTKILGLKTVGSKEIVGLKNCWALINLVSRIFFC